MTPRTPAAILALLAATAALPACAPVPEPFISAGLTVAQAGTAAFLGGEMQASLRRSMPEVHQAGRDALAALQLPVEFDELSDKEGTITARELGGRLIVLRIRPVSPVVTALRIKVGNFGDQPLSRLLLDEVTTRLGALPPG